MWDKCMHDLVMRGISGTNCVSNIHMTHTTDIYGETYPKILFKGY